MNIVIWIFAIVGMLFTAVFVIVMGGFFIYRLSSERQKREAETLRRNHESAKTLVGRPAGLH